MPTTGRNKVGFLMCGLASAGILGPHGDGADGKYLGEGGRMYGSGYTEKSIEFVRCCLY